MRGGGVRRSPRTGAAAEASLSAASRYWMPVSMWKSMRAMRPWDAHEARRQPHSHGAGPCRDRVPPRSQLHPVAARAAGRHAGHHPAALAEPHHDPGRRLLARIVTHRPDRAAHHNAAQPRRNGRRTRRACEPRPPQDEREHADCPRARPDRVPPHVTLRTSRVTPIRSVDQGGIAMNGTRRRPDCRCSEQESSRRRY